MYIKQYNSVTNKRGPHNTTGEHKREKGILSF